MIYLFHNNLSLKKFAGKFTCIINEEILSSKVISQISILISKKLCKIIVHNINKTPILTILTSRFFNISNFAFNLPKAFFTTTRWDEWKWLKSFCFWEFRSLKGGIKKEEIEYVKSLKR